MVSQVKLSSLTRQSNISTSGFEGDASCVSSSPGNTNLYSTDLDDEVFAPSRNSVKIRSSKDCGLFFQNIESVSSRSNNPMSHSVVTAEHNNPKSKVDASITNMSGVSHQIRSKRVSITKLPVNPLFVGSCYKCDELHMLEKKNQVKYLLEKFIQGGRVNEGLLADEFDELWESGNLDLLLLKEKKVSAVNEMPCQKLERYPNMFPYFILIVPEALKLVATPL